VIKLSSPSGVPVQQPRPEAKPAPDPTGGTVTGAGNLSGRAVPEWHGKTPDSKIPPHVRMRVFLAHDGRCHLSKRKIMPADYWECDHIVALCNGGEHRESNLAPALAEPHKIKTKADVREKSKVARLRKRHLGIKKPRTIRSWRRFSGQIVYAGRDR
jgi:5-methylcytosine-specific restriction protein A